MFFYMINYVNNNNNYDKNIHVSFLYKLTRSHLVGEFFLKILIRKNWKKNNLQIKI